MNTVSFPPIFLPAIPLTDSGIGRTGISPARDLFIHREGGAEGPGGPARKTPVEIRWGGNPVASYPIGPGQPMRFANPSLPIAFKIFLHHDKGTICYQLDFEGLAFPTTIRVDEGATGNIRRERTGKSFATVTIPPFEFTPGQRRFAGMFVPSQRSTVPPLFLAPGRYCLTTSEGPLKSIPLVLALPVAPSSRTQSRRKATSTKETKAKPVMESPPCDPLREAIAASLHKWRQGNIRLGFRPTSDREWCARTGNITREVNLATTSYEDLPCDYQERYRATATLIIGKIRETLIQQRSLDEAVVRSVAGSLYVKFQEEILALKKKGGPARHTGDDAPPSLPYLPFSELPPPHQERWISQTRGALETFLEFSKNETLVVNQIPA